MNQLTAPPSPLQLIDQTDLQAMLLWLMNYGQPRVGMYSARGWHCTIEMNTNTVGSAFKVASDFAMDSPVLAVQQCLERMVIAVNAVKGGAA